MYNKDQVDEIVQKALKAQAEDFTRKIHASRLEMLKVAQRLANETTVEENPYSKFSLHSTYQAILEVSKAFEKGFEVTT